VLSVAGLSPSNHASNKLSENGRADTLLLPPGAHRFQKRDVERPQDGYLERPQRLALHAAVRVTDDIVAHSNIRVPKRAQLRECVSMLVANLLKVYCADPLRLLNIPFSRGGYTTTRYVPAAISFRKMLQVREYFRSTNYAEFAPGFYHSFSGNSRTSKLRCTPGLFSYFNPEGRSVSYPPSFISLVNNRNTSTTTSGDVRSWSLFNIERTEDVDPIVLRKKVPIPNSRRKKSVWLPYDETPERTEMRSNIRQWNKLLSRHWVDLLLTSLPSRDTSYAIVTDFFLRISTLGRAR
jgi:hypothetical protein